MFSASREVCRCLSGEDRCSARREYRRHRQGRSDLRCPDGFSAPHRRTAMQFRAPGSDSLIRHPQRKLTRARISFKICFPISSCCSESSRFCINFCRLSMERDVTSKNIFISDRHTKRRRFQTLAMARLARGHTHEGFVFLFCRIRSGLTVAALYIFDQPLKSHIVHTDARADRGNAP